MSPTSQISKTKSSSIDALSTVLRGLIERDYFMQMDDLNWTIHPSEWHDSMTDVRIARLIEVSSTASKNSIEPLLAGMGSNGIGPMMLVSGTRDGASIYFGAHSPGTTMLSSDESFSMLQNMLQVHLPGARLEPPLEMEDFREQIIRPIDEFTHIACLTGVPNSSSERSAGLENFIDGMRGEQYLLLMIAQPIKPQTLDGFLRKCRHLSSDIHSRVRQTDNKSEQHTTSTGTSSNQTYSGLDNIISGLISGFTPLHFLAGSGSSSSISQGDTWSEGDALTEGISFERIDKELAHVESFLDEFSDRIEKGKHSGLWNTGVYILTRNRQALNLGQSLLRGMVSGSATGAEPLRSVSLTRQIDDVRTSLEQFDIPMIEWVDGAHHPLGKLLDQFSTLLNGNELSLWLSIPKRQVVGMNVVPMAQFNLNPPEMERGITLGRIINSGRVTTKEAHIGVNDLSRHAFVTGVTGAGKTNTCLLLLKAAARNGIPFLVIEPAKREYRQLAGVDGLACQVYTLGDEAESPLRLNPFQFPLGFPLLTHIDYLKAIFNASFPMYASMPYILEEAILGVYEDWGWDVTTGKNKYMDGPAAMQLLPTLSDLYNRIDIVVAEKRYAERLTMDISAALKARIKSLLVGSKGKMLDVRISNPLDELFTKPTVLELRRIGSDDEKCFLIALLLVWLYEFCETRQGGPALQHLTLIEEAHRILQNLPPVSNEMIGARSQAVNTFSNMLSEIRAYGEGLVIVDQIPAKLSPDVIKNTDLKILHRLVAADDRDFVGRAMTLTPEQIENVARLRTGDAVVYYEAAHTPMLLKFDEVQWKKTNREQTISNSASSKVKRSATCEQCEFPCQYGDSVMPSQTIHASVNQAIAHLIMSPPETWEKEWIELVSHAFSELKKQGIPRTDLSGMLFCTLAKSFEQGFELMVRLYSACKDQHRQRILCELNSSLVIRSLIINGEKAEIMPLLNKLSSRIKTEIAIKPGVARAGCTLCANPCIFGFSISLVDADQMKDLRRTLTANLRKSQQGEVISVTKETILSLEKGAMISSNGFIHCALTHMNLTLSRLESLGFHKSIS